MSREVKPDVSPCLFFLPAAAPSVVDLYNTFVSEIVALDLPSAIEAKPLIDVRSFLSPFISSPFIQPSH